MNAILLKADGTEEVIAPANGKHFKLAELQKYVGGYIEVINTPTEHILIVNEDGKFTSPRNARATQVWYDSYKDQDVDFMGDFISGDVVVCHTSMMK